MAKSKKPVSKKSSAKAKTVTKKAPKAKPASKKPQAKSKAKAAPKAKSVSKNVRRPSTTPNIPNLEIAKIENNLQEIKTILEEYAACPKSRWLFGLRSLRYAQTPYINSWSFAKGKTPKLSGYAG